MSDSNIRAGIIGSGFAARFHYNALTRVYGAHVKIVGGYSPTPKNLRIFCEDKGLLEFKSPEALIDAVDVVHICTPPATHEPLAIEVLAADRHVIIEKPFTGYFGNDAKEFDGKNFSRESGLEQALLSIKRILDAEKQSKGSIMYAENWIYAPAIQKEKEIIEKTGAQILWIQAQQSHSGSHSEDYGKWRLSGGGSLMGKGAHPIAASIYLKQVQGLSTNGKPIRPKSISCRTHAITKLPELDFQGNLRDQCQDVEDHALAHLVFEDHTMADIVASELLQGGVKNYLEVHANNHRTICNMGPNNAMVSYNPREDNYKDIYVVEKTGTKQGWSHISPDESWFNGYQHEMEAFYTSLASNGHIESNSTLAADTIATIYAGYLSAEKSGKEVQIPIMDH